MLYIHRSLINSWPYSDHSPGIQLRAVSMAHLPRRVSELRRTEGHGTPQARGFGTQVPSRSSSFSSSSNLPALSLSHTQTTGFSSSESSEYKPGRRGRPSYELNNSAKRGLIRLFVSTPKPLEQIAEALQHSDGPRYVFLDRS